MAKVIDQAHYREIGKLVCEREGLDPGQVLEEFDSTEVGNDRFMVTLRLPVFLSRAEYEDIIVQAKARASAGGS